MLSQRRWDWPGGNSEPSHVATSHDGAHLALILRESWLLPPYQKCVKNQALDEVLVEKGEEEQTKSASECSSGSGRRR